MRTKIVTWTKNCFSWVGDLFQAVTAGLMLCGVYCVIAAVTLSLTLGPPLFLIAIFTVFVAAIKYLFYG